VLHRRGDELPERCSRSGRIELRAAPPARSLSFGLLSTSGGNVSHDYDELKHRLAEVHDLRTAAELLFWDQTVMMPSRGAVCG